LGRIEKVLSEKNWEVEIVINNSGGPKSGKILEASEEDFLKALNRHLIFSHRLAQLCIPQMTSKGFGRIINIISTSVKIPINGITVNNILPGFTNTERLSELSQVWAKQQNVSLAILKEKLEKSVPSGRFGTVKEVASVVGFLASSAASYINGVSLRVDGGRTGSI